MKRPAMRHEQEDVRARALTELATRERKVTALILATIAATLLATAALLAVLFAVFS